MIGDRYVIPSRYGFVSREEWMQALVANPPEFKPKPPAWWIRSQLEQGRSESAAYSIWAMHYQPARKYVIWDQAPDEDWLALGYMV